MRKLFVLFVLCVIASFEMLNAQVLLASVNSNKSQTTRLATNLPDCDLLPINLLIGRTIGLAYKAEPCPTCPPVKAVITPCKKVVHKKICAVIPTKVKSNGVVINNNITINNGTTSSKPPVDSSRLNSVKIDSTISGSKDGGVILNNNIVINNNGNNGSNPSNNDMILSEIKDLKSKLGSYQDFTKANDQQDKNMAALKMQLKYQSYKTSGWAKIVGGLLSQSVGVGLVVWANTPIIKTRPVVTTYERDVTHIEYDLQELPLELPPATINGAGAGKSSSMFSGIKKCGTVPQVTPPSEPPVVPPVVVVTPVVVVPPVVVVEPVVVTPVVVTPIVVTPVIVTPQPIDNSDHSVDNSDHSVTNNTTIINNTTINNTTNNTTIINVTHRYVLVPHTVTEKLSFTVESQETYKASRNKTAFYIGAGALFIGGAILEASGISDFGKAHNIKLTLNQNFMQSMNYGQSSSFSSKNLLANTQLGVRITF